jgi:hypothetical protein
MEDEAFLERVSTGAESFRKGDMLRCRLRLLQTRRPDGLYTERHVLRVLAHLPGGVQTSLYDLPLPDADEAE